MTFRSSASKFMLEKLVAVFFFTATAVYFISPVIDVDFPWHLKTGEYIWQQKEVPKTDPFSLFSSGGPGEKFIMSQYWLAQLLFYFQYTLAGTMGIIILRSIIFTGIIVILWLLMKNTPLVLKTLILYGTVILFSFYSNDRPQFFSFFLGTAVIALLVNYGKTYSRRSLFVLPLIMFVWSNMHGGFIFGDVAIALFCLGETLTYFSLRQSKKLLTRNNLFTLSVAGLISILLSYLNPNSYYAFSFAIDSLSSPHGIREYISPIAETEGAYATRYNFIYWAIVGYSLIALVVNLRRLALAHLGLIFFALALSLSASRFVPFFAVTGLIVSGQYRLPFERFERLALFDKLKAPAMAVVLFLVLLWGGSLSYTRAQMNTLQSLPETVLFPEKASQFLLNNFEGGNIFNSRNCGSYFLWRLFPQFRTFIDTRALDLHVVKDYSTIVFAMRHDEDGSAYLDALNALLLKGSNRGDANLERIASEKEKWDVLLKQYDIDIIVHEATNFFSGVIYPLTLRLIKDDQWKLVYSDGIVMIFVRDIPRFRLLIAKYRLDKEKIYDEIGMETSRQIGKSRHAPIYSSLAFALTMKNGSDEAIGKLMKHANYLDPNDPQTSIIEAMILLKKHNN